MKKFVNISIMMSLAGFGFKLLHLPGASVMLTVGLSSLAMCYFVVGLPLTFLRRGKSEEELEAEKNFLKGIGGKLTGYSLAIALIGILFKIQLYPSSEIMLLAGTISLAIIGAFAFMQFNETKSAYLRHLLTKVVIIGSIAALLYAIPKRKILESRFPGHPEYVQAVVNSWADPDNLDLQVKVLQERAKFMGIPYESMSDSTKEDSPTN